MKFEIKVPSVTWVSFIESIGVKFAKDTAVVALLQCKDSSTKIDLS